MKRSTWISLIDILAFISFLLLIATGILLKYVLPPGSGGLETHGMGWKAASHSISLVWGLTRHEWGTIHFYTSLCFLIVIAIHLFIHWRWIAVSFKGKSPHESRLQTGIGIVSILGLILLMFALVLGPKTESNRIAIEQDRNPQAL